MRIIRIIIIIVTFLILLISISGCIETNQNSQNQNNQNNKILHKDITVTVFWVGEDATDDNNYISNSQSAWDENWLDSYGGVDDPKSRNGFYPRNFTPKENPFYFALPYDNIAEDGSLKSNGRCPGNICKDSWIKIIKGDKVVYAQWEDVGPFEENDIGYVFGTDKPKNKINNNAGLDVSPAVRDYLGLEDIDKISWQFVDFIDVPDGPWKEIITKSIK